MTGETHSVATPPLVTPSRDVAPASGAPLARPDVQPKPAVPATAPVSTAPQPSFPVSLQFDQDTHRVIIEARDSSGLVVFQVPFKAAIPTTAGPTASDTRGHRLNSKA